MANDKNIYQGAGSIKNENSNYTRSVLFTCRTVWPFTLFPDDLVIDKKKVSIVHNALFARNIDTINIVDILKASVYHGPIFGSVQLTTRFFSNKSLNFTHLWKKDALKARALIQGLIIAREKGLKLEKMTNEEVLSTCLSLGKATV